MNNPMQERLNAIKARAEAATPGPWENYQSLMNYGAEPPYSIVNGFKKHSDKNHEFYQAEKDMRFIAEARQDIPWLIEQVERLQAENERLRQNVQQTPEH